MKKLRLIGDCHGQKLNYQKIARKSDYSIGLGDIDFDYKFLNSLDSNYHKVLGGNHDNYDELWKLPHNLGDYGKSKLNGFEFFFVRGGFSIDWQWRVKHEQETGQKIWWREEELSIPEMEKCLNLYKDTKSELVLTHECPKQVADIIGNTGVLEHFGFDPQTFTTNTQELLQKCFESYQPKLWVFGHFHLNADFTIGRTRFVCLNMIPRYRYFIDINEDLHVI